MLKGVDGNVVDSGELRGEVVPGRCFAIVREPTLPLGDRFSSRLPRNSLRLPSPALVCDPNVFLGLSRTFVLGICSKSLSLPSRSRCLSDWLQPESRVLLLSVARVGLRADIPVNLSASAWAEAEEETRTGEWCRMGWGIREGLERLVLLIPLQLFGPLGPTWFLWYSIGDVKAFKKLRWFSRI